MAKMFTAKQAEKFGPAIVAKSEGQIKPTYKESTKAKIKEALEIEVEPVAPELSQEPYKPEGLVTEYVDEAEPEVAKPAKKRRAKRKAGKKAAKKKEADLGEVDSE